MSLLVGGDILGGRVAKYPRCTFVELKKRNRRATHANINQCVWHVKHPGERYVKGRKIARVPKSAFLPAGFDSYAACRQSALAQAKGLRRSAVMKCVWAYPAKPRKKRAKKAAPVIVAL